MAHAWEEKIQQTREFHRTVMLAPWAYRNIYEFSHIWGLVWQTIPDKAKNW